MEIHKKGDPTLFLVGGGSLKQGERSLDLGFPIKACTESILKCESSKMHDGRSVFCLCQSFWPWKSVYILSQLVTLQPQLMQFLVVVCNSSHFLILLLNIRFIKLIRSTFSAKTSTMEESSQLRGSDKPSISSYTTEYVSGQSCWSPCSASCRPSSRSLGARVHTGSTPALSSSSTTGRSPWTEPQAACILRRLRRPPTAALLGVSPKLTSG